MKPILIISLLCSLVSLSATAQATDSRSGNATLERGRALTVLGGCHDCHTPGYPEAAGKVPKAEWLTGNAVGFQGPWGTSYPVNLRLYVQGKTEKEWIARVRQPMRPPMPWFNLRDSSDADLIAMYRYMRSLGAAGQPAPPPAAPGVAVSTPYFEFVPKNLPKQARATH
ncbi:MAG TPA: cytochrome C [Gammaproteobacteria bacterium]|nr:cytochrome C [Gammaproteobacteria bacterium]